MRMEVDRDKRDIRLWTNPEHSYNLSFRHPQYQTWLVCLSEEWWRKPEVEVIGSVGINIMPRAIEFARVIWAK